MKFYVTEEEKRLIDEKMKQLPIKQYGAYLRKMAIDGYILVVDRSDTKTYIRELQAVSRNINQIAKRANATGQSAPGRYDHGSRNYHTQDGSGTKTFV